MNLNFKNYTLKIKKNVLIENANFNVTFNKMQIVGKNGTGKTTLLNNIYKDKSNKLKVDVDKITYINQDLILIKQITIEENIDFLAKYPDKTKEQYLKIFETLNLKTKVAKLSGRQKQILNLLIALSQDYELLLVDEPFNNLDIQKREIVKDLLKNLNTNIIVVAHGYNLEFCDIKLEIKGGKIYEKK